MLNLNRTILLVIILVGLSGVIWWLSATQENAASPKVILRLKPEQVTSIGISRSGGPGDPAKITLRLKGKNWYVTAPVRDQADRDVLTNFLNVFAKLTVVDTVASPGKLGDYGLDRPALTVRLTIKNQPAIEFLIGSETPIPLEYYAKLADKPEVYIIDNSVKSGLDRELKNLRHKQILFLAENQVRAVNIRKQEGYPGQVQLQPAGGEWRIITPYPEKVEPGKVATLLSGLSNLQAEDFIDNVRDLKQYGFDQPQYWFELSLGSGKTISLKTSKVGENYYIATNLAPTVFKLNSAYSLTPLLFKPEEQIRKKLFEHPKSAIKTATYQDEKGREHPLPGKRLAEVLESLGKLSISGAYLEKGQPVWKEHFAEKPICRLALAFKKTRPQLVLTLYPASTKDKYLIASSERPLIYEINAADWGQIRDKIKN
ncbi:MAG: DUF4340 domain-containing protein [Bacillota bacterium]